MTGVNYGIIRIRLCKAFSINIKSAVIKHSYHSRFLTANDGVKYLSFYVVRHLLANKVYLSREWRQFTMKTPNRSQILFSILRQLGLVGWEREIKLIMSHDE